MLCNKNNSSLLFVKMLGSRSGLKLLGNPYEFRINRDTSNSIFCHTHVLDIPGMNADYILIYFWKTQIKLEKM